MRFAAAVMVAHGVAAKLAKFVISIFGVSGAWRLLSLSR